MNTPPLRPDQAEVTVMVKAASQPTARPDALIYALGVTSDGAWRRLYPLDLKPDILGKRFRRWDTIRFTQQKTTEDTRAESLRIDPASITIMGDMPYSKRREFVGALEVTNLNQAMSEGKTVILLRPRKTMLHVREKTGDDYAAERQTFETVARLTGGDITPPKTYPYKFSYHFWTDEGDYESDFKDWEMHATFDNLSKSYGEAQSVARVIQLWGKEYLRKGILFVMSRHSADAGYWDINGIISVEEIEDMNNTSYSFNVVA